MKLIVLRENLKDGLDSISRAISESGNLPILKNFLIETLPNNKIKFSSTNLELGINKIFGAKIIEEGKLTIPFSAFNNIISNLDSERVNLEIESNNLIIKTDNYYAKIQTISFDDYPIIPKIENFEKFIEINSNELISSLIKVSQAAQFSEIRPELSGILFDFQINTFKMVATDSFRLAEKILFNKSFKTNFDSGFKHIIPLKTINEVIRAFGGDSAVSIFIDQSQILFKTQDCEIISRLITGEYPDYNQIIPKSFNSEIILEKDKLINSIKLVSSFSGKSGEVKFKIKEGRLLEIYSSNQYVGENNYLIPITLKGDEFKEINFNSKYILDGLKSISSKDIFFGFNGDNKPALIKNIQNDDYIYILMPVKPI